MPLSVNEFFYACGLFGDTIHSELDKTYARYNMLLAERKELDIISFDNDDDILLHKNVTKMIDCRIYETKLEILLYKNIISKNQDGFIKILDRVKESIHKYMEIYQDGVTDGSFNEKEYLEVCNSSMELYNTFSKIVYGN